MFGSRPHNLSPITSMQTIRRKKGPLRMLLIKKKFCFVLDGEGDKFHQLQASECCFALTKFEKLPRPSIDWPILEV